MIRMQKMCQSQQFVTWDAGFSVTWKIKVRLLTLSRQFVTWNPSFFQPIASFRGKQIENPALAEMFFFSLELELGTI